MSSCRRRLQSSFRRQSLPMPVCTQVAKYSIVLLDVHARLRDTLDVRSRNEQVLPAVIVKIKKASPIASHGARELTHSTGIGHILKTFAAFVAIDGKGLVIQCDKHDVRVTVIVVIAEVQSHTGNKLAIFHQRDALRKCHFLELFSSRSEERR